MAAVAALMLALASCGGGGSTGAASTAAGRSANLAAALRFLPATANASYTFQFADWSAIEQAFGVTTGRLRSKAGQVLQEHLNKLGSPPAGNAEFDLNSIPGAIWAASDVAWDASYEPISGGAPVSVTGFRPEFQLSSVEHYLTRCGFTAHSVGGVPVYSAALGATLDCAGPLGDRLPLPATNYAVEAQNHLVVLSASPSSISAALSNQSSRNVSPVVQSLAQALLPSSAIALGVGPRLCAELAQPSFLAGRVATPQQVQRAEHMYLPAAPYAGFGFGYTYSGSGVSGRLAFTYSDPQTAHKDLAAREHTLRTGVSLQSGRAYATSVRVKSGAVTGRTAILQLGPATGGRLELALMLDHLDLGFARCG
ncbi:MAG: hypothetical protein ACJ764_06245 [Solirubrobacteraceae bacterium]